VVVSPSDSNFPLLKKWPLWWTTTSKQSTDMAIYAPVYIASKGIQILQFIPTQTRQNHALK